ncbi:MAG: ABC transporter substrate-binding protein [Trebonia sp.]
MAARSLNAAGGLDGHPVQLIDKDNGSSPATAATDAQALVAAKVSLVFDLDILDTVWIARRLPSPPARSSQPSPWSRKRLDASGLDVLRRAVETP